MFGFTLIREKTLETKVKALTAAALSYVTGSRGWWPLIHEMSTGAWQRNEDLDVDLALSNPTLYACITLIATDIGKLRPKLVEQDTDGIWSEVESAAFSPVLRKPNHFQNRVEFFTWWETFKLIHGNTVAIKARDGRNVVTALYILDWTRIKVLVAPDGSVFYQLSRDELAKIPEETIVVPAREIIHDRVCPLFHPLVGVSPIYAAGWPAIQGLNIRRMSDKFFSGGSKPGGVLTAPGEISDATAKRIEAFWQTNFSGDNLGKVAILGDGLKYEQLAMSAEQSDLVDQLRMTDEDICRCFHMPRHKVQVGPDPSYDNIESLNLQYYSDCLQSHIESLEILLDEGLELTTVPGRTLGVEFDLTGLVRMDSQRQMDFAARGVEKAIFAPNYARSLFDQKPVTGGDSPMLQQQMWTLEQLAERGDPPPATPQLPAPREPVAAAPSTAPPAAAEEKRLSAADLSRALTLFRKSHDEVAA